MGEVSASRTTAHVIKMRTALFIAALGLIAVLSPQPTTAAEAATPETCVGLRQRAADDVQVTEARWLAAEPLPAAPGSASVVAPAHCLVRLMIGARASNIPEMGYGTGVEIRLPQAWNGRLLFQGGGGMNGSLLPAIGRVAGFTSALERGYAVVSTDGGHQGRNALDSRFGVDQQARIDFAYGAVTRATREARSLLPAYYGRRAHHSYFMGCSTGGREAMVVAQRLPLEFDGVVSGNAAWNLTRLVMHQIFSLQTITRIAPRDASGKPELARAFSDAQLTAVSDAVLKRCDALDGLRDDSINDFEACKFDPKDMVCGKAGAPAAGQCLMAPQADALQKIFGGVRNSRGEALDGTFAFDTGVATPAWRSMHLGTATSPPANALLGGETLRNYVLTPPDAAFDPLRFDFDRDFARTLETAAINDPMGTQHTTFAGRGGKLIAYNGLSDQSMSTGAIVEWYSRITPRDATGPQDWARLFLVPGMTHCGGGRSTDQFDVLSAIQAWVEEGRAPDRIVAKGTAFPGRTRPLCPYPKVARYDGGDAESEKSFSCR